MGRGRTRFVGAWRASINALRSAYNERVDAGMTAPDMRLLHLVREPRCDGGRQIARLVTCEAQADRSSTDVPVLSRYAGVFSEPV